MSEPRFPVSWYEMPRSARWAMWREWLRGRLRWEHHESWFAYRHGLEQELERERFRQVLSKARLSWEQMAEIGNAGQRPPLKYRRVAGPKPLPPEKPNGQTS